MSLAKQYNKPGSLWICGWTASVPWSLAPRRALATRLPKDWRKKALKLDKGSSKAHLDKVGKITREQLEEIAKTKMKDLTAADLAAAVKTIAGSARSMGVTVEGV
jgi:hypothetical protein